MNSFLQSLYATVPFRSQISSSNALQDFPNDPDFLLLNLQYLFSKLHINAISLQNDKIDPSFLKNLVPEPFRSNKAQQDTMEFGRSLLEDIEKRMKDSPLQGFIREIFNVEIIHSYHCLECGNVSKNLEESCDIPISFCKIY